MGRPHPARLRLIQTADRRSVMTTSTTAVPLLSEFVAYLEGRRDSIFASDATADFHFPGQDFGVRGAAALDDLLDQARPAGSTVENVTALPTPEGFIAEIRYRTHHDDTVYETVSIVRLHDGRADRLVHYCTGGTPDVPRDLGVVVGTNRSVSH
jgi:hypothetical protein